MKLRTESPSSRPYSGHEPSHNSSSTQSVRERVPSQTHELRRNRRWLHIRLINVTDPISYKPGFIARITSIQWHPIGLCRRGEPSGLDSEVADLVRCERVRVI